MFTDTWIQVVVCWAVFLAVTIIPIWYNHRRQSEGPVKGGNKPVTIDAGIIEQWISEIDKYDRQPRPHHGACDLARAILMAKKEAYQNVLKIARR